MLFFHQGVGHTGFMLFCTKATHLRKVGFLIIGSPLHVLVDFIQNRSILSLKSLFGKVN